MNTIPAAPVDPNAPVKVSVLLSDEATRNIATVCTALDTDRRTLIRTISDHHEYLYFDDYKIVNERHTSKVQAEVNPKFLATGAKSLKCKEKFLVASSIFNQIFSQETIDPEILELPPKFVKELVSDGLRWFQFFKATGLPVEDAVGVEKAKISRLELSPTQSESLLCYGLFASKAVSPNIFGFRGMLQGGELNMDLILPVQ